MIDLNKIYMCKNGFEVKLFHKNDLDGSIIGAFYSKPHEKWLPALWLSNGECTEIGVSFDLVIVEPKIISKPLLIKYLGAYYSIAKEYCWANYIGLSPNGNVWVFENIPNIESTHFYADNSKNSCIDTNVIFEGNWKDSLREIKNIVCEGF